MMTEQYTFGPGPNNILQYKTSIMKNAVQNYSRVSTVIGASALISTSSPSFSQDGAVISASF